MKRIKITHYSKYFSQNRLLRVWSLITRANSTCIYTLGAPQFHSKYTMMTFRRGERATVECKSAGDKPMTFSWKKNGAILEWAKETR